MRLPIYAATVVATGVDPAAAPDLPDLPEWIAGPERRAVRVADAHTGEIPAVTMEVVR